MNELSFNWDSESYDRSCFEFTDHFLRMSFPKVTGGKSIAKIVGYQDLTPKQTELLELLLENNSITYEQMALKMKVKRTTAVQKHMNGLKKAGAVSRDQDYGGAWIINYHDD